LKGAAKTADLTPLGVGGGKYDYTGARLGQTEFIKAKRGQNKLKN